MTAGSPRTAAYCCCARSRRAWGSPISLAACLPDERDPDRLSHTLADMSRTRLFAIACGYEDCDDLDRLVWLQAGQTKPSGQRAAAR